MMRFYSDTLLILILKNQRNNLYGSYVNSPSDGAVLLVLSVWLISL